MLRWKWLSLIALLLTVATGAFAQVNPQQALEDKIREKLDRMFTSDQYMIDIQTTGGSASMQNADAFLPGLELMGPSANIGNGQGSSPTQNLSNGLLRGDLLLIIDKSISKERVRVAEDIVRRIVNGERLSKSIRVAVKQQDIIKVPPAPPAAPAAPPEPSIFDHLEANKDLVMRGLMVLWGAVISLMAAHFTLKRLLGQMGSRASEETPVPRRGGFTAAEGTSEKSSDEVAKRKLAASKEELYSKDQALLNSISEVVSEAKSEPRKVSKIFTRWVSQSEENARFAGIFLKNCDIKTIENVCSLLHPSDLEKILAHNIQEFDPFSDENQKVLERMRADMALLAAEQLLKEKPDPLEFMRILSDEDIALVLQDEPLDTLALVATQIPAHRLMRFYSGLKPQVLNDLLAVISHIHSPSLDDFDAIREHLQRKTATLSSSLFNDKARVKTIAHLIDVVTVPGTQITMLERLRQENKTLFAIVRPQIFMASDLNHLSVRALTVLIQTLDPAIFATALAGLGVDFDKFAGHLPEAYQAIFIDGVRRTYEINMQEQAWRRIKLTLKEMIGNGLIAQSEMMAAISIAEEEREKGAQRSSDENVDLQSFSDAS